MDSCGLRLKYYRKRAGMSLEELAEAMGVVKQTVSKWELGDIPRMTLPRIEKMARILGCEPWDLCGWNPPEKEASEEAKAVDSDPELRFIVRLMLDNPSLADTVKGFVSAALRTAEEKSS